MFSFLHSEIFWIALTAAASWALVWRTNTSTKKQLQLDKMTSLINMQYKLENKFYGNALIIERKKLSIQFLNNAHHDDIQENVLNFFDTVGTLLRRNAVDEELVYTGLSFYIKGWWEASKNYIYYERKRQNDNTLFEDFETLFNRMTQFEMNKKKLSEKNVGKNGYENKRFLTDESNL